MAPAATSQFDQVALQRRQQLAGAAGPAALLRNAKVFGIACFACLGGLLYGYNQVKLANSFVQTRHSNCFRVFSLAF